MYDHFFHSVTSTEGKAHAFSLCHREWRENPLSLSHADSRSLSHTLTHRLLLSHSQNEGHANFHSQTDTQSGGYTYSRTLASTHTER